MNREDAYNRIDAIIAKHEIDEEYVTITSALDYDALRMARKALEQEPCEDAISRQAVLDCFTATKLKKFDFILHAREEIKKLPSVTPQPKMGRWIAYEVRLPDRTILNYRCSVCGRKLIGYNTETLSEAPFCHCGAKMVEPQAEKE